MPNAKRIGHSSGYNNPIPTTDAIIEYKGGIVLVTRRNPPHGLAIPGGFAEGGLTLDQNVRKEAKEETGLTFIVKGKQPFAIFDDPDRDPRGHMLSITYAGRGYGELVAGDDAKEARAYSIDEIKHLIGGGSIDDMTLQFDHGKILSEYFAKRDYFLEQRPFGKAGVVGRFRPLHVGSATLLEALCEQADEVIIGIGSSNKYNARNPFTPDETREMIDAHLSKEFSNYTFVYIPDYGHIPEFRDGKKWAGEVASAFGTLDAFVTGNDYVSSLLEKSYVIVKGPDIIYEGKWVMMSGTMVRAEMAKGSDWKRMVPVAVSDYIEQNRLADRFRKEFGLETLAAIADDKVYRRDAAAERLRVTGG